jgi:YD repeat-containing protein
MLRITPALAALGMACFLFTNNALAFLINETDYQIPNSTWIPPYTLPEFAPSGFEFVRQYDSDKLNDGWMGFGWTWDVTGLKGFTSGISSYIESLTSSTKVVLGDGSSWEFDLSVASIIDFSYLDVTAAPLGIFRLEFTTDSRINSFTDYLGNTTTYNYDSTGNLLSATDFLGFTTSYLYDTNHRIQTRIGPDGDRTDYPIPEPSTVILLSLGLAGLGFTRRRMKA